MHQILFRLSLSTSFLFCLLSDIGCVSAKAKARFTTAAFLRPQLAYNTIAPLPFTRKQVHLRRFAIRLDRSDFQKSFSSSDQPHVPKAFQIFQQGRKMGSHFSVPVPVDYALLEKQNAETSSAIIEHYANNREFKILSAYEGKLTVTRDKEDDEKLEKGIDFAKKKGVIDPNFKPEPYTTIDVLGKTPDQVADIIIESTKKGGDGGAGSVIVIVGLSGTGKGTTVSRLQQKLEADGKKVVSWSNGNIFRSVTLLAATWCEQNCEDKQFDANKALTKENLATFMGMLSFGKFNDKFDTKIEGLGLNLLVSEVQNTELKQPKVSKNIPTVAQSTQGEVIMFAADAVKQMGEDGWFVLLEGREQTVNYVRSPHRFALVLSDDTLIGKRRAAQRLMGEGLKAVDKATATPESIEQTMNECLVKMVSEI